MNNHIIILFQLPDQMKRKFQPICDLNLATCNPDVSRYRRGMLNQASLVGLREEDSVLHWKEQNIHANLTTAGQKYWIYESEVACGVVTSITSKQFTQKRKFCCYICTIFMQLYKISTVHETKQAVRQNNDSFPTHTVDQGSPNSVPEGRCPAV